MVDDIESQIQHDDDDDEGGSIKGKTEDGVGREPGQRSLSNCCRVFVRLVSVLLIVFDVFHDWLQCTDLVDIDMGKVANATSQRVTMGPGNATSRPSLGDYFNIPRSQQITAAWESLNNVSRLYDQGIWEHFDAECDIFMSFATSVYSFTVAFGTLFALIRVLNIAGETIKDMRLDCCIGYQILHGWTETMFAILVEDLPQCIVLLLVASSCKTSQLLPVKVLVTFLSGFLKNTVRALGCRQGRDPCCSQCCRPDFGCPLWTPCYSCYRWTCCGPDTCCSLRPVPWELGLDVPLVCSCGRLVVCGGEGLCGDKGTCCSYRCFSCFKEKNDDPVFSSLLVYVLSAVHVILIGAVIFFSVDQCDWLQFLSKLKLSVSTAQC